MGKTSFRFWMPASLSPYASAFGILAGQFPLGGQAQFGDLGLQKRDVDFGAGDGEHAADIQQVFFGSALAEVFQLFQDHVFDGRDPDRLAVANLHALPMGQAPGDQRLVAREVQIGFQARVVMDDIEMSAPGAPRFDGDDFGRRTIEPLGRVESGQCLDLGIVQDDHQIDVVGEPRFAVDDARHGSGHHMRDAGLVERLGENEEEISGLHGGTTYSLPGAIGIQTSRDAAFSALGFSNGGQKNRRWRPVPAFWRPASP